MPSSTHDLIFLLPDSVISPLIGIVVNGCIHCKGIITRLLVTGLPQLSSDITHAIESFPYIYLCPDQDLWAKFSFFFDMEKKLFSITSWTSISLISFLPHVHCPSCVITVTEGLFTPVGPDLEVPFSSQSFILYSFTCCHSALFIS